MLLWPRQVWIPEKAGIAGCGAGGSTGLGILLCRGGMGVCSVRELRAGTVKLAAVLLSLGVAAQMFVGRSPSLQGKGVR